MSERKLRKYSDQSEDLSLSEQQHPLKTYLFYGLTVSSILFASLVFIFFVWLENNPTESAIHLSKTFVISPYILLISFFASTYITRSYHQDSNKQLLISLSSSLVSGVVFSVLQVYACVTLFENNPTLNFNPGTIVIFVVTGLHLLFVCFGMLYLFYLTLKAYDNWNDPIKSLVYFSNQYEVRRLELATAYWYFTCIIWPLVFFTILIAS